MFRYLINCSVVYIKWIKFLFLYCTSKIKRWSNWNAVFFSLNRVGVHLVIVSVWITNMTKLFKRSNVLYNSHLNRIMHTHCWAMNIHLSMNSNVLWHVSERPYNWIHEVTKLGKSSNRFVREYWWVSLTKGMAWRWFI